MVVLRMVLLCLDTAVDLYTLVTSTVQAMKSLSLIVHPTHGE